MAQINSQPGHRYVGSVNVHETMPTCFGYRTRPIPSDRHIPSARRGIYPVRSARSNLSRMFFSRRMKWRSTGGQRYPDHEQPSRKCRRTLARPATATSGPPGFPHMGTPVTPNPHLPAPRRGSKGQHEARCRGRLRRFARLQTSPPWPHAGTPNLGGGRVGVRGHGSAWGGTRGPRTCPRPRGVSPLWMAGGSWVVYAAGSCPCHAPRNEPVWGERLSPLHVPLKTRVLVCTSGPRGKQTLIVSGNANVSDVVFYDVGSYMLEVIKANASNAGPSLHQ